MIYAQMITGESFNQRTGALKMKQSKLAREWSDIIDLAKHNSSIALWLAARDAAFRAGERSDGYTAAIRKEYRALMRGDFTF